MDKMDYKFFDRKMSAIINKCRFCEKCSGVLAYYSGKEPDENKQLCDLSVDTKFKLVLRHRRECKFYTIRRHNAIERDTVYPGHNYSPFDNNHKDLLSDNSTDDNFEGYDKLYTAFNYDIDIDEMKSQCISNFPLYPNTIAYTNNWDECVELLFKMQQITHVYPSYNKVIELLNSSSIPTKTNLLTVPRGGFYKGLWIEYKNIVDFTKEENKKIKQKMKSTIMVYLYHTWFKKIEDKHQEGIYLALDLCKPFSLGKDLVFYMTNVFKDEIALKYTNTNDESSEGEIEFIQLSALEKAQLAAELSDSGCSDWLEIDHEEIEYNKMLSRLGYEYDDDNLYDKDGHKISDDYNILKPIY